MYCWQSCMKKLLLLRWHSCCKKNFAFERQKASDHHTVRRGKISIIVAVSCFFGSVDVWGMGVLIFFAFLAFLLLTSLASFTFHFDFVIMVEELKHRLHYQICNLLHHSSSLSRVTRFFISIIAKCSLFSS